jgi:hypothetical protein
MLLNPRLGQFLALKFLVPLEAAAWKKNIQTKIREKYTRVYISDVNVVIICIIPGSACFELEMCVSSYTISV